MSALLSWECFSPRALRGYGAPTGLLPELPGRGAVLCGARVLGRRDLSRLSLRRRDRDVQRGRVPLRPRDPDWDHVRVGHRVELETVGLGRGAPHRAARLAVVAGLAVGVQDRGAEVGEDQVDALDGDADLVGAADPAAESPERVALAPVHRAGDRRPVLPEPLSWGLAENRAGDPGRL